MTLLSAVLASPSRVRHAAEHDPALRFSPTKVELVSGMYADVATLKVVHKLGVQYTNFVLQGAVRRNQLAVVQFLRSQGCPWDSFVFNIAAARGHAAMCAYLHAARCPWSAATCDEAAGHGRADTLRW
jgi:hypothetical protein